MSKVLEQMTNDKLIDYALDNCGEAAELEKRRQAALMLHNQRTRNDPNTITVPVGAPTEAHLKALKAKVGSNDF